MHRLAPGFPGSEHKRKDVTRDVDEQHTRDYTSEAQTLPLTLTNIGTVLLKKLAVPLIAMSQSQDNPVSIVRPLNVALDATGLGPSDSSFGAGDLLLLFNNAVAGLDKSPSATYFYDTAAAIPGWRLDTTPADPSDRGADIIPAGTGFVIRKAAGALSLQFGWTLDV